MAAVGTSPHPAGWGGGYTVDGDPVPEVAALIDWLDARPEPEAHTCATGLRTRTLLVAEEAGLDDWIRRWQADRG